MLATRMSRTTADLVLLGALLALLVLGMSGLGIYHRRRRRHLTEAAQALGLTLVDPRSIEAGMLHHTLDGQSLLWLRLCAVGMLDGRAARLAEYSYTIGKGKGAVTYHNLQLCLECPDSWPPIHIADVRGIEHRPGEDFVRIVPGMSADSPDQATALLSTRARALMAQGAYYEWWDISDGWFACTWRKPCSAKQLPVLIERTTAVLNALLDAS